MSKNLQPSGDDAGFDAPLYVPIKRRSFFMYAGATAGATALILSGCGDDEVEPGNPNTVNVGSGSVGVLNYAYALEQLEAGFYTALRTGTYYTGLAAGSAEKQILDDLYYHEVIHREFFKAALTRDAATSMIKSNLEPDFSGIDFNVRLSAAGAARMGVLNAAKAFEDLGVAAYNGAGRFLATDNAGLNYLVAAGKIVSVEARHAALIRDLISEGSFVDSDVVRIATDGLEISKTPAEVAAVANTFLKEGSKLNVSGLV
ncbi:ferritin-like domain-containing protein [Hymenobacter sp. BT175]|uniref:ferritin-like domain-containing protein n=1 Tax=Hymenobacter translucens TaxID=2886507 RepID=UPI001D0F455D|nr:ferritin-like domain-containing protein [Hymenobacter translucens]MCC2548451.1 ferritin-like domain-containing protein [Hymenobacter translucens]